jgi:hypothetical protein
MAATHEPHDRPRPTVRLRTKLALLAVVLLAVPFGLALGLGMGPSPDEDPDGADRPATVAPSAAASPDSDTVDTSSTTAAPPATTASPEARSARRARTPSTPVSPGSIPEAGPSPAPAPPAPPPAPPEPLFAISCQNCSSTLGGYSFAAGVFDAGFTLMNQGDENLHLWLEGWNGIDPIGNDWSLAPGETAHLHLIGCSPIALVAFGGPMTLERHLTVHTDTWQGPLTYDLHFTAQENQAVPVCVS